MPLVEYIRSPESGRYVKVGGGTYNRLLKDKTYASKAKRARRIKRPAPGTKTKHPHGRVTSARNVTLPKANPRSLKRTLKTIPESRQARRKHLESMMKHKGKGRGGRTRGWAAAAPQKGRERHELMEKCGDQCFLFPETEGFPICAALREGRGCKVDCRGVTSALVRAKQWNYPRAAKSANALERKYKCKPRQAKTRAKKTIKSTK